MQAKALTWALAPLALAINVAHAEVRVEVVDKTFDPAGSMLAYTEFELSGEPLAEALGLDLDVLDPNQLNQPTRFDYTAGIESYEYSEEAMYALNYQSRMGPHLANGPRNEARGGGMAKLGERFLELSSSVGFPAEEIPLNLYPISVPYKAGEPSYAAAVDTKVVNSGEVEVRTADGKILKAKADTPAYYRDYASLGWTEAKMQRALNPAAIGGILLKEVLWSQDFLGGMHVVDSDEEVEAQSATMDQDGKHALGVSTADGFNGVVLTEISLDKMTLLQSRLGYDGKTLGAAFGPDYDPARKAVWFPHEVSVNEVEANGAKKLGDLKVTDAASSLRDTWMLLWPISEYYAFSDQRQGNTAQNPAFLAVFDGSPFEAAPKANTDANPGNDVVGTDAFSLASNLSNLLFRNLTELHYNAKAGTLVDRYDGKAGQHVTTYDAAYSLVALSIFQRARDALPVGYASAEGGDVNLKTPQGQKALEVLKAQADFILAKLVGKNGLVHDGISLDGKVDAGQSLDSQFAALRGLTAAFTATGDAKYRTAARNIYLAVDQQLFDKAIGTWAAKPGQATEQTPWTAAAISAGLRSAMLNLKNAEGEKAPALELAQLTERYSQWFKTVINGPAVDQGLQLAEWLGDSGENVIAGQGGDTDADHVAQVSAAGYAQVMAGRVKVYAK